MKVVPSTAGAKMEKDFLVRVNMSTNNRQKSPDLYISPKRERNSQDAVSETERSFSKSWTMTVMWCAR